MEDVMEETDNSVVLYFAGSDNDNESDDEGDVFHDIDVDDDEGTTITTAANETAIVEVKSLDELTVIIRAHDNDDDDDNDNTSMTNNIDPIDDVDSNYATTVAAAAAISSRISLILATTDSTTAVVDESTSSVASSSSSSSSLTNGLDNIIQNNNYIVECQQEITRMKELLAVPAPSVGNSVQQITADTGLMQSSHSHRVSKNKRRQQLEQTQQPHTLRLSSPPPEEEDGGAVAAAVATLAAISTSPSKTLRSSPVVSSNNGYAKQIDDDERIADVEQLEEIAKNTLDRTLLLSPPEEKEENEHYEAPNSILDSTATTVIVSPGGGGGGGNTPKDIPRQVIVDVQKQTLNQNDAGYFFPSEENHHSRHRGRRRSSEVGPVDLEESYEQEVEEYARVFFRPPPFLPIESVNVVSGQNAFDSGTVDFSSWDATDEAAAPDTNSPSAVDDGSSSTGKTNTNRNKPVPTLKFTNIRDSSAVLSPKPLRLTRPNNRDGLGIGIGTSPVAAPAPAAPATATATAKDQNNGLDIIKNSNNIVECQKEMRIPMMKELLAVPSPNKQQQPKNNGIDIITTNNLVVDSSSQSLLRLSRPTRDGIVIGTSPVANASPAPAPAKDQHNDLHIIHSNNNIVACQKGEENHNDGRVVGVNEISIVSSVDEPEVVADDDNNSTAHNPIDTADSATAAALSIISSNSSSHSFLASSVFDDSWSLASSTLAIPISPLEKQQQPPNNGSDLIHNNHVIEESQKGKGDVEKSNNKDEEWVVGILNETCSTVQSEEDSFVFDDDSSSSSSSSSLPPPIPPPDTHHHHPEQQQQQDNGSIDIVHRSNNVVEEEDQKREEIDDFSSSVLSSLPARIPQRLDEQLQQHRQQRQQRQQQQLDNGIDIIHKNNVVKKGQNIKEIDDFSSLLLSSLPARIPPLLDKQQQQQRQQQQHNGMLNIFHKNNNVVVEEGPNREELDDFLSSCLSSLPAIQSLDIQQQQQQQQQQQHNGIIDDFSSSLLASLPVIFPLLDKQQQQQILTNTNRVFEKQGQPKKEEESTINDDERVVGINATSGLEEDCRRRALRGSHARHLRALRIRCANGGDICDNSTVQIANNTNKDNFKEKTKVLIENDPLVDTQITADDYREELLLARSLRSNRDRSRSRSRSRSRRLRRNYTNSKSNKSPVLSSVECSTPEKISEELNTLIESSCKASTEVVDYGCQASTELVDYGCGMMTAATNTLELFFIGFKSSTTACAATTTTACTGTAPTVAAATTSTNDIVTTKEIAAYNNTMQATNTAHHDVTMNEIEIVTTEELAAYQNIQEIATTNLVIIAP